jgi:Na+:H+ antiporter
LSLMMGQGRRRRVVSWNMIAAFAVMACIMSVLQWFEPTPLAASQTDNTAAVSDGDDNVSPENQSTGVTDDVTADIGEDHEGEDGNGAHDDPVAQVLLALMVILLCAKIVGDLFERFGMPSVLGELTVGVLLGNWLLLTGSHVFDFFHPEASPAAAMTGHSIEMLAGMGVVLLLFEVGLESRLSEMMSVGVSSLLVACLGVIVPIVLGFAVGFALVSESWSEWQVPAFLGATLCATSVGITARVLRDIGRSQDRESKIILGAAVIDDVLGLVVLAIVVGVIKEGDAFRAGSLVKIVGLSVAFLATALLAGVIQLPKYVFGAASYLRGHGLLVSAALVICFFFSWAANLVGLAPIIGAFAAGLILEGAHYRDVGHKWSNRRLEDAIAPISALLVPIFFVSMGASVDLTAFGDTSVWLLAAGLTAAAIIGKLVCYYGVREKGLNRIAVGVGMIPRGEVGLIFANEGTKLTTPDGHKVIDSSVFSAIVVMVMLTTMATPPLLKIVMGKKSSGPTSPNDGDNDEEAADHQT